MNRPFRAVEWMREARARIEVEDVSLSWAEQQRKTLTILEKDPLWAKLRTRLVQSTIGVRMTK